MSKPIVLQLGDDIKWNHDLHKIFQEKFAIKRSYSMDRDAFIAALRGHVFGDFLAIYRPFWNTGGEMGNWDEELISLLPASCKIFASAGAGFDWVDTNSLAKRGILYCNSAAACTESVADTAIYLLLSCFRRFTWSSLSARSLDPAKFQAAHSGIAAITHNPNNHTLGIIGLGKIGYRIAQKAFSAFDMKVLYYDVVKSSKEREDAVGATFFERMEDMLASSDAVVLATPFAGEKVMTSSQFLRMKHGAFFINIARGKLVDEAALVDALEVGHLGGAGLDVHFDEPYVNEKLANMENVEVLCHMAGASVESHVGFERMGMENIISYHDTGKAVSPVNEKLVDAVKVQREAKL